METESQNNAARIERHRKNAMGSQLLLRKLRRHHYDQAPDALKWVPSLIVGDPILRRLNDAIAALAPIDAMPVPGNIHIEELRTVRAGSLKSIIACASRYYRVPIDDILSARRTVKITRARQVAMYLAIEHTTHSVAGIGRALCRDHTTIIHGHKVISRKRKEDPLVALQLEVLLRQISAMGDLPEPGEVKLARLTRKMENSKWDIELEVQLIQDVKSGKGWTEIGRALGISTSAACNKYIRLERAKSAFDRAGA